MKQFEDFLNEQKNTDDLQYKAIVFVGGGATTTFKFAFVEDKRPAAGEIVHVNWNDWKNSDKEDVSDEKMKGRVVKALMSGVQFNQAVELNTKLKNARSFEEKIDMIAKATGRKITKAGVKTKLNLF